MRVSRFAPALALALAASIAGPTRSQPLKEVPKNALRPGDAAPPLRFETVLRGPKPSEITWDALHGSVVVLDFWGTWCEPCVAGLPHLNELAETFRTRPVRFIAVGHENARKTEWFLAKHPIDAWVALDTDLALYRAYTAWGIPHAVVVDTKGVVAAVLNPAKLTPKILEDVLAGMRPTYSPLPASAYWEPEVSAKWFREVGEMPPPTPTP